MNDDRPGAMSTSWVGMRLGIDPVRVNAMRRAGELYAVRPTGSQEWLYPAWQFGPDWKPLPPVQRALKAAKEAGLGERELESLLNRRVGMVRGNRRLRDLLLEGDEERVLAEIRGAT